MPGLADGSGLKRVGVAVARPVVMTAEQRRHDRLPLRVECDWTRDAFITDLGAGGCHVDCQRVPAVGNEVALSFALAGIPLTVRGTVVHAQRNVGFALRFDSLDDAVRDQIVAFLSARELGD